MLSRWRKRHRFLWCRTFYIKFGLIFFKNLAHRNDLAKKKIQGHFYFRRYNFKGHDVESYIPITLFSYHLNWNDFKWYWIPDIPIESFPLQYLSGTIGVIDLLKSVFECQEMSSELQNVFNSPSRTSKIFKLFKLLSE